ncbi:MAG: hypothetical protein ABEL04_09720 [Salinibacter sp.]|uniref:hypothetical protein n=1 Tax=Salinibacter sp. TaxID=2065818 RepID=UPI0035D4EEE2
MGRGRPLVMRVTAAPAGVNDGRGEKERSGACEGEKRTSENRAFHDAWGAVIEQGEEQAVEAV